MKPAYRLLALVSVIWICAGCKKQAAPSTAFRTFYMGVTPWPADFTVEEVTRAYQFTNEHCDIVSHHIDEGIPYQEAYNNSGWPAALLDDITYRKAQTMSGKKLFLSISSLALSRVQKAPYSRFSTGISDAVKNQWSQLPFNDPKVITAYVNYVRLLADRLQPDFINYAVESNVENWPPADFAVYKDFVAAVYLQLKALYPTKPILLSLIVNETPEALSYARQLLPYSDYMALSAYPYTHVSSSANGNTDPALFPSNYFNRYIDLAPEKPFCFAETGYIAKELVIPAFSLNKQGTAEWQERYLQKVCTLLNERKGKFLIWFCFKDYDAAVERLQSTGQYQDLFGLWTHIGLVDRNNAQRTAYNSWLQWMSKPKQ